jgi:hypothetical protein
MDDFTKSVLEALAVNTNKDGGTARFKAALVRARAAAPNQRAEIDRVKSKFVAKASGPSKVALARLLRVPPASLPRWLRARLAVEDIPPAVPSPAAPAADLPPPDSPPYDDEVSDSEPAAPEPEDEPHPTRPFREVLALPCLFTYSDARASYKRLCLLRHPDKPTGSKRAMIELHAALEAALCHTVAEDARAAAYQLAVPEPAGSSKLISIPRAGGETPSDDDLIFL